MKQLGWRTFRAVTVAGLLLAFGTAAQALIVTGVFDPPGNGGNIPGFNGDAVFDINQECVDLGPGWHSTGTDNACGPSFMTQALVNLYSTSPEDPTTTPIDFFTLGQFPIFGVLIGSDGSVQGVDSDPMGPAHGHGVYASDFFWLEFASDCINNSCFAGLAKLAGDPAFLLVNTLNDDPNSAEVSAPATVRFVPGNLLAVPEPGTLSLILGAAGLGWLRRRKSAQG